MSYVLLDLNKDHVSSGPLALTRKTKLIWIGFDLFFLSLTSSIRSLDSPTAANASIWRSPVT